MKFYTACTAVIVMVAASAQSSIVSSTFDTGDEGWRFRQYSDATSTLLPFEDVTFDAADGQPSGSIKAQDTVGGTFWFFAPQSFLGDMSASYGQALSFDIKSSNGLYFPNNPNGDVMLLGNNGMYLRTSIGPRPSTSWKNYVIPIVEGTWEMTDIEGWNNLGVADATAIQAVLGDLQELRIRGDYQQNLDDYGHLDNIVITPEPTSLAMAILGALWLMIRRKERHSL